VLNNLQAFFNNQQIGIERAKDKVTRSGVVMSCLTLGDASFVTVQQKDGTLIGNVGNRDDVTLYEVLIPVDRSINGMNLTDEGVIGMEIDVICASKGKYPIVATLRMSLKDGAGAGSSPFVFTREDIIHARAISPDGSLNSAEAHDFLKLLGYTDEHLKALGESSMEDLKLTNVVFNAGDEATTGKQTLRHMKGEASLPASVAALAKKPTSAKLKKKTCYLAPKVFHAR
jgi:hypothetical protein